MQKRDNTCESLERETDVSQTRKFPHNHALPLTSNLGGVINIFRNYLD